MSQITRCPSCGTMFKVVADQLRISEGWVRCGQCQEVFDATQSMLLADGEPSAEPAPAEAHAAPPAVWRTPDSETGFASALAAAAQLPAPVEEGASVAAAGYELPAAAEDEDEALPLADSAPDAPQPAAAPETESESESVAVPEPEVQAEPEPEPEPEPEAESEPELETEPEPAVEPGFVRAARRKAFWQRKGVRAALGLVSGVLVLGLAAQVALQERNALAAWQPSLRPALQSLCGVAGCTLAARQDIGQMVIASSAFTRTARADGYLLALTIENQASTPLAMPAVELTLTDVQDRPVLRRVLLPAQLSAPSTLEAQAEWSVSIPVAVTETDARIAGYRALVFYP